MLACRAAEGSGPAMPAASSRPRSVQPISDMTARAARLKDLASIEGVRDNHLVGYGLVVGLNGTGDQTTQAPFTIQSISNMLAKFGVPVPASVAAQMQLKNVAAVTVTAPVATRPAAVGCE